MVADKTLGHCPALGKGHIGRSRAALGRVVHGRVDDPHLGPVSVADDQLVALRGQVRDDPGGRPHLLQLLRRGISQGVASQRHHNPFFITFHNAS